MQVLLPGRSTTEEDLAFADLADLLSRATGVQVRPHLSAHLGGVRPAIVVGRAGESPLVRSLCMGECMHDIEDLAPDEILVHAVPDSDPPAVVVTGGSSRAAVDAIYVLLEEVLGFGFFPEGERIPNLRQWVPGPLHLRLRPAMRERLFLTHPFWAAPWRYCSRLWDANEWEALILWLRRKRFTGLVCFHDEGSHLWGKAACIWPLPKAKGRDALRGFVMPPDQRTALNTRVFHLARSRGISIVYKLMYSVLPDVYAETRPDLPFHPQRTDSVAICAASPECPRAMRTFWERILALHRPEEKQMYIVCPYQHREHVCEHVHDRTVPALDAIEIIRSLDADARIYIETPCGPDREANLREWSELRECLPSGVGAVDWSSGLKEPEPGSEFDGFGGPWMTTIHLSRPGFYPPANAALTPEQMQSMWATARDKGAEGVVVFNVLANTSSYHCDYAAALSWDPSITSEQHLPRYARRRYGEGPADGMVLAYKHMSRALVQELTLPGAPNSLEKTLAAADPKAPGHCEAMRRELERVNEWLEATCSARTAASEALKRNDEELLPQRFLRETAYVEWRCLGLLALLRAHLANSPTEAASLVVESVRHLRRLGWSYHYGDLAMSQIRERAREGRIRYTEWFLANWRDVGRRWITEVPRSWLLPTYEYFEDYERAVLAAAPEHVREMARALLPPRQVDEDEARQRAMRRLTGPRPEARS